MNRHLVAALLLTGALCASLAREAAAVKVDLSLNVVPTNVALPNNGGTWRLVAKTDSSVGIAAISAYLTGINIPGLAYEGGAASLGAILNGGNPFAATIGGAVNIVYGQDIATGPIVPGVGTILKSSGPDPFGDPAWNDATGIFVGTYSGVVPAFVVAGANQTDANTLASVIVGQAALDADTSTVVRVQVPEPASIVGAVFVALAAVAARRRR
jgi:hypothetical protein